MIFCPHVSKIAVPPFFFYAHAVFGTLGVLHQDRMTSVGKDHFTVFK